MTGRPPTVGVVIRYKDSASTLGRVLEGLGRQTVRPSCVVGVDTGSTDGSTRILRDAGATIVPWPHAYHHSRTLNAGVAACPADLVLALSSHTTLVSPDALERMVRALDDPRCACASGRQPPPSLVGTVDLDRLRADGLPFPSIFSNSFGLFRRRLWERLPFNERFRIAEDYEWAMAHLAAGYTCAIVEFEARYERSGGTRIFSCMLHDAALARAHRLRLWDEPLRWFHRPILEGLGTALRHPSRWKTGYALVRMGSQFAAGRLLGPLFAGAARTRSIVPFATTPPASVAAG